MVTSHVECNIASLSEPELLTDLNEPSVKLPPEVVSLPDQARP